MKHSEFLCKDCHETKVNASSVRKYTVWKEEIILSIFHFDFFVSLPCCINRNVINRKSYLTYFNNQLGRVPIVTNKRIINALFPRKIQVRKCCSAVVISFTLKSVLAWTITDKVILAITYTMNIAISRLWPEMCYYTTPRDTIHTELYECGTP